MSKSHTPSKTPVSDALTEDKIYEIALRNGFSVKEQPDGTMDLNPYVYEFARALGAEVETTVVASFFSGNSGGNHEGHR